MIVTTDLLSRLTMLQGLHLSARKDLDEVEASLASVLAFLTAPLYCGREGWRPGYYVRDDGAPRPVGNLECRCSWASALEIVPVTRCIVLRWPIEDLLQLL